MFTDLAIVMVALGILAGVVFPSAIVSLGVPAALVLRPSFYVATLTAGTLVGGLNFLVAHRVVGSRLRAMAQRMRDVGDVIKEATYTGDWTRCSPEKCELPTDSDDALGTAAAAFNRLMYALRDSRAVEHTLSAFTSGLSQHLTLGDLGGVMVQGMVECVDGTGGALVTIDDGEQQLVATTAIPAGVLDDPAIRSAARGTRTAVLHPSQLASGIGVTPDEMDQWVLVTPLRREGSGVLGALITRVASQPPATALRLADVMRAAAAVALDNAMTHARVQTLATMDALTGLCNRRSGRAQLERVWTAAQQRKRPMGVLMIDLDHFKEVNDTHGHDVGDRVLREVGAVLREVVRDRDVVFRSGGEEFAAGLMDADVDGVRRVGERIRRRIAELRIVDGQTPVAVTASVGGVAVREGRGAAIDDLLRRADQALYRSKDDGRDRVTIDGVDARTAPAGTGRQVP